MASSYLFEVRRDAPIVWWRLDESAGNVIDSAGNLAAQVSTGTFTRSVAGLVQDGGTAYTYTSNTGVIGVALGGFGVPAGGSYTLEAWIKTTDASATEKLVAGYKFAPATHQGSVTLSTTGVPTFSVYNTVGGGLAITGPTAVNDGVTHHLVGVHEAGAMRLYVDGVQVASGTVAGTAKALTTFNAVGVAGISLGYLGTVDNIALYGSALSATRVSAHYTAGTTLTTDAFIAAHGVETLGVATAAARNAGSGVEALGVAAGVSARNAASGVEVLGSPIPLTEARVSALMAQVPMVLAPATVEARLSTVVGQVPMVIAPATVEARLAAVVAQVAVHLIPASGDPTGLVATPTTTTIHLTWVAPASGGPVDSYDVQIDAGAPISTALATTYDFTGVTPGTAHTVSVRTVNTGGTSAWISVVSTTPHLPPGVPSAVTATVTAITATLTWAAPTDGGQVTSYQVRLDGAAPIAVGMATSYVFTGLTPEADYDLEVRSAGPGPPGMSAWVLVAKRTATAAPPSLTLGWEPSISEAGIDGYEVALDGSPRDSIDGGLVRYEFSGLDFDTTYSLTVRAFDRSGQRSGWSVPVVATTPEIV